MKWDTVVSMRRLLFSLVSLVLLGWFFILYQFHAALDQHLQLPEPRILLVGKGDTLSGVIYRLEAEGVLQRAQWLVWYSQLNEATLIRVGEYDLTTDLTGVGLLQRLNSGKVLQYQVTFVEGSTVRDIMKTLSSQPKLIDDVGSMTTSQYEKTFGFVPLLSEGWFFPDTYSYVSGTKTSELLLQALRRMRAVLEEEWRAKADGLPYRSPYEALIMASIIEKETGAANERAEIAGVFIRRMQAGMRLQTDPTVIYGLGPVFDGDLKKSHLKEPTPYNTYVIDGLPPTPIALVGRAAIHAALHPAAGSALFFVAKGDGTHVFSSTLAEHENAVNAFQRQRRAGYRSSPVVTPDEATAPETTNAADPGAVSLPSTTP